MRAEAMEQGYTALGAWAGLHGDEINPGIEAVLWSQLVSAWTAYEILATDVWIRAVNLRPGALGVPAWEYQAKPRQDGGAVEEAVEPKKAKGISLDVLQQIDFDLQNQFGEIIRRDK